MNQHVDSNAHRESEASLRSSGVSARRVSVPAPGPRLDPRLIVAGHGRTRASGDGATVRVWDLADLPAEEGSHPSSRSAKAAGVSRRPSPDAPGAPGRRARKQVPVPMCFVTSRLDRCPRPR